MTADQVLNTLTGKALQAWERRFQELLRVGLTEDQAATMAFREQADAAEADTARQRDRRAR